MKYWLLVGKKTSGPFNPRDLIKLEGFTPENLACPENKAVKKRKNWKSAKRFKDISAILAASMAPRKAAKPLASAEVKQDVRITDLDFSKIGKKRQDIGGVKEIWGRLVLEGASNLAPLAVAVFVCVGAWAYGKSMVPEYEKYQAQHKAKTAPKKAAKEKSHYEGDLSNLAGPVKAAEDSIGMISESIDGKTPEQRAAQAAADAVKAKEEAEAQAKADAAAETPLPDIPAVEEALGQAAQDAKEDAPGGAKLSVDPGKKIFRKNIFEHGPKFGGFLGDRSKAFGERMTSPVVPSGSDKNHH